MNKNNKYCIVVFVPLLLLVFFAGINYLAYKYDRRWDVTKAKQHTLARETTEVIGQLRQDIRLTAFYVGIPPKYLEDLFNEYERLSGGKIKTEIVDPVAQIGYAAQFGNIIDGKEKKVFVCSGKERRDIDFTKSALSEEELTNAIIRVTRRNRKIYFLAGHGEYNIFDEKAKGLSALAKLLQANNTEVKELVLGITGDIPEDCDVLVVAGPKEDLDDGEQEILKEYLKRGGDALFLIEHIVVTTPEKPLSEEEKNKNPSFNGILNEWGIKVADDIVVDLSSHAGDDVGCPATRNYMSHKAIVSSLDYTFYVRPRSISVLSNRRKSIRLAPLVLTSSKKDSWAEKDRALRIKFDEGTDTPGPVPFAFIIWESKNFEGDAKPSDTRLIVFTDADFLSNIFIDQYSNAEMAMNIINWLSDLDYRAFMPEKKIDVPRLDLTSGQKRLIVLILFAMPVFIAAMGGIVWMNLRGRTGV